MQTENIAEMLQISESNKQLLEDRVSTFSFKSQCPVIHKGQPVSGAYLVLNGQLRIYTYSAHGGEATLYFLRTGEICLLTVNCLFQDVRYPAWVEAFPNTDVAVIPGNIYRDLFRREQGLQDTTLSALSKLTFTLMDSLEEAQTCNLQQRLARFILGHANHEGYLTITQAELAGHLGTTREVIARLLKHFRDDKLVTTARGRLHIRDAKALASIVAASCEE